ncbi:MAG: 1-deoxy-D-xylulose-5-phosphate synthase [Nitrospira sp.]|nr:1-deoxy-D-xylulose-5-phosphate synthase [Nitrospira sp.]MBX3341720.1 1-deoxy-D-xylulose-5-phosphate synthase [Nitrospira sp.]MBX3372006.1 1-deoxy-D-xylulose-5-phosphate synthase [Nitrospira sp.]MBX7038237.1 1-deoxy-D-xylulose-5-phosphate synthase [Nitrospira sp.]MCW5793355.1 1-deoxy-D-xylulose-5-phosphate synthase [Nitrospira sp.]
MSLLKNIHSPADLKRLSPEQFPELCQEIREQILSVVSNVGGHLASNLGVVELTVALQYLLDTPKDKIVWDTSNQAYTHKLLTGRREQFHTLRQYGGLSGFCKREESAYDTFNAGHAGTGVSAAFGMVEAREQRGEKHKVVCVVGDGAMTAGMTLEGLHHAGGTNKDFIVVLNDNQMSISRNVGAISAYLNRTFTGEFYARMREETGQLLRKIPHIGAEMQKIARRAEELAKGAILPGLLFEELGFQYAGPIDGHNFEHLLPTLENVLKMKGPVLLHVITKKGLGYQAAMDNPVWFHACPPFVRETGVPAKKAVRPSYTSMAVDALIKVARQDKRVVAITAAMCEGTGLNAFEKEFPERIYDVGIAEQHAVTFAAGMAAQGMKPVVALYSTFLQRAYDQVVHDVATQNLPVTFCIDRGGLVAEDGTTHHGAFDFAFLRHVPNMVVAAPKDENELQHMIKTCVSFDGPASVRYARGVSLGVPMDPEPTTLPIGKGELLREGTDVAIVAIGVTVWPAMKAAERLAQEGISAAVVNARFAKPLDTELILKTAKNVRCLVTVEEGCKMGGFGSAVLETLSEAGVMLRTKILGLPDWYIEQGPQDLLRERYGLTADGIYNSVKQLFGAGVVADDAARLASLVGSLPHGDEQGS